MINEEDEKETIETKEAIKEAQDRYDEVLRDKHEQELAELRLKYILDQNSIRSSGYEDWMEEGIEKGIEENKRETVINLTKKGMDINFIKDITKLTEKEIKEIQKAANL